MTGFAVVNEGALEHVSTQPGLTRRFPGWQLNSRAGA